MTDVIIQNLVIKKKELLDDLLQQSIQSIINGPNIDRILDRRGQILEKLERNDESLRTREEQTGISALQQEQRLFGKIGQVLILIQENTAETIQAVEHQIKEIEMERSVLDRGRRLSGYIEQGRMRKKNRAVTSL